MIECLLCLLLADEILNIVNDESVDTLVEIKELVELGTLHGGSVLTLEQSCSQVKHTRTRIALLDADSYCLNQMCLSDTAGTEDKEGVENLELGIIGNRLTYRLSNLVAVADAIVLKSIVGIELRVNILDHLLLEGIRSCTGERSHSLTRM